MKHYSFLFVIIALLFAACSTDTSRVTELFPIQTGSKFEYIDRAGKVVIGPQFAEASIFRDGTALVATGDSVLKWGYIDKTGKYLLGPKYSEASTFSEDIAFIVTEGNAPAAIDKTGAVKFTLPGVEQVDNFYEGYAAFSVLTDKGERWGFINKQGQTKIKPAYALVGYFAENVCSVMNEDGKWGFIDKDGNTVIKCQYDNVSSFLGNSARVSTGGKWGAINSKGDYLVKPLYENMESDGGAYAVELNGNWGWIDRAGKTIVSFDFDDALPFNGSDYAAVRRAEKWGFTDKSGKMVIAPQFEFAFGFDGNQALVGLGGKYGFIGKDGKVLVPAQFDQAGIDYVVSYFGISSAYSSVRTDTSTPGHVAFRWLSAFYHMRYDDARKLSSDDTKALLEQFTGLTTYMSDSARHEMQKVKVGIKDVKTEGDRSVVVYNTSDNPGKEQEINLINKAGKWQVQFTKNDIAGSANKEDAK